MAAGWNSKWYKGGPNPSKEELNSQSSWFDLRARLCPTTTVLDGSPAVHGPLRPIDERFYIVEARLGWRQYPQFRFPQGKLIYASSDGERVHSRTVDAVCENGEWALDAGVTVHTSAVFERSSGEPPTETHELSPAEVAEEYREVLEDVHGIEVILG